MLVNYTLEPIEINGVVYDQRHGGAFDRGAADSYYNRPRSPHYYVGDTYNSPKVLLVPSDPAFEEYMAGYDYNEQHGDKKNWC